MPPTGNANRILSTQPQTSPDKENATPADKAAKLFERLGNSITSLPNSLTRTQGLINGTEAAILFGAALGTPEPLGNKLKRILETQDRFQSTHHLLGPALESKTQELTNIFTALGELADTHVADTGNRSHIKRSLTLAQGWLTNKPAL